MTTRESSSSGAEAKRRFENTVWSRVVLAGKADAPESEQALATLCELYWPPVYAFLRRRGYSPSNASDLTQSFFAELIRERLLQTADREKGRFRTFLLGALQNHVSNQRAFEQATKRGGGYELVSMDEQAAEGAYVCEPATDLSPEKLFERRWALQVLGEAMKQIRAEYDRAGESEFFTALAPFIGRNNRGDYSALARQLGKNEGAARTMVYRLRNRFRERIREVVAATVAERSEIENELRHIQSVLTS